MIKLIAAVRKEILVLIRDIYGMLLLFLMPVLLLIILTLAQEKAIGTSNNEKTEILLISQSQSSFPDSLSSVLGASGFFTVIRAIDSRPLTEQKARGLIRDGEYQLGLFISEQDTAIRLLVDPTLQQQYRESLISSVTWYVKSLQSRMVMHQFLDGLTPGSELIFNKAIAENLHKMPQLSEQYVVREKATLQPTIVQNNIPGFILFAMFFIVIPLSGSLIAEKNDGSFLRMKTLPITTSLILAPKVFLYFGVCLVQFVIMLAAGIWLFPGLFGLPALQTGNHHLAVIISTCASALAAVGFGLLVGAFSKSHSQSALSGSILVVILGLISGTFFPVYLLPHGLRILGMASPVRWGVDNYIGLFVREASLADILPNIFLILAFFVFAMTISIFIFAKQK